MTQLTLTPLSLLCLTFFLLLCWHAIASNPVKQLPPASTQSLCLISSVGFFLLWNIKAGLHPGLEFHFLGLTAVTLMLGWRLTLFVALAALLFISAWGAEPWPLLGINALAGIALPIMVSWGAYQLYQRKMPRHFFIYVFVCVFFAAMLAILCRHLGLSLLYLLDNTYNAEIIYRDFLSLWPLLLFPEGLINGMAITLMAVYKPEWLCTFDDKQYFR